MTTIVHLHPLLTTQPTVQAMQRNENSDIIKPKKKSNKKIQPKQPRASSSKKRKRPQEEITDLAIVDTSHKKKCVESALDNDDRTIIGQFAKSTRCTAFWNQLHAAEAARTGGILCNEGDKADTDANTATGCKYSEISDIRESKNYKTILRQFTQEQLIQHFRCINILCRLSRKRTADLEIVSAYQMITSCANPKLAAIAYQTEAETITHFIHVHMHNDADEAANFKLLRKTLRTVLPESEARVETREGMLEFIKQYTGDCYFK